MCKPKSRVAIFFILLAVFAFAIPSAGAVVEVWGMATAGPGVGDPQRAALLDARTRVVEQAWVSLQAVALLQGSLSRGNFLQVLSSGNIINEKELEWKVDVSQKDKTDRPVVLYKVLLRTDVYIPPSPDDPAFAEDEGLSKAVGLDSGREYDLLEFYRLLTKFPLEKAFIKFLPYTAKALASDNGDKKGTIL